MKKKIIFFVFVTVLVTALTHSFNNATSNASGAPAAKTGSPGDGSTCKDCHSGSSVTAQTGWITSDIPSSGYVPGSTYTITATATVSNITKFGFEISPQNSSGTVLGTMMCTNSTETKLISTNKYITHKSAGTTATNGSKTWSFSWTAPTKGSGDVTFYGAFLAANANGDDSGDKVHTSTLTVSEEVTTTIAEMNNTIHNVNVYPNPIHNEFSVFYSLEKSEKISIQLLDINGRIVSPFIEATRTSGEHTENFYLNNSINIGIYFLKIYTEQSSYMQKVLVI